MEGKDLGLSEVWLREWWKASVQRQIVLPGASSCEAKRTERSEFGAEKCRDGWLMPPQNLELTKGFHQSIFKGNGGRDMVSCCKLLVAGRNPWFLQLPA